MAGCCEISKIDKGQFFLVLKAANGPSTAIRKV
jgi:uncharacterized protein YegP (UPF0339 family)